MLLLLNLVLLLVSSFAVAQDDGWHLDVTYVLANEELDPIVSPNAQSSHMHKVIGGSAFGASYNFDTYAAASCSSLEIQADKSNYWMPALYAVEQSTGHYKPLSAAIRFYYFLGRSSPAEVVKAFPQGLRMLAGSPDNKATTVAAAFTCQINSDFSGSLGADNFNFARDCPYGMKTELFFPQCWDGLNLYKSDGSHMSYPTGGLVRDGACPISHPVRLPTIQLEYTWYPGNVNPGTALQGTLLWANGDTTGYGIHGDFVNGWDIDVLTQALNSTACGIGTGDAIPMTSCPVLNAYSNDAAAKACTPSLGILKEPNGNADLTALTALPGCNLPWGSTGPKPICNPAVPALSVSGLTGTDGAYVAAANQQANLVLPTKPGWSDIMCAQAYTALTGAVSYKDPALTATSCKSLCLKGGYNYAATGQIDAGNWWCICGSAYDPTSALYPEMCTTPCPGNSSETCGGATHGFDVYYAPPGTTDTIAVGADGSEDLGCYSTTDSTGLLGKATYNFASNTMTQEVCLQACNTRNSTWAAMTSGHYCYCGDDLDLGSGTYLPASFCTSTCYGNSSEICGDLYRATVFNISAADISSFAAYHPPGFQGCYQDGGGHLALTNASWATNTMTPQSCIAGCAELGYAYAGVEYAKQCFCGSTFSGGTREPDSQCVMPCTGNASAVCGGSNLMDLYEIPTTNGVIAALDASHPSGYEGCYTDSGSDLTWATFYTYTASSMTVELCKTACSGFGYSYAGVENGQVCKCGKTPPASTKVVASMSCTTKCKGNATETCGGSGFTEVYAVANSTSAAGAGASGDQGCYDNTYKGLSAYSFTYATMTVEICQNSCAEFNYTLSGVSGKYCYCGNKFGTGQLLPATSCTTACPGNSKEICGGSTQISVSPAVAAAAVTRPTGYKACWTDSSSTRTLTGYYYTGSSMSANACRTACNLQGYSYAGTEYSTQCYCGNTVAAGAQAPSIMCNMACSGKATEICGGNNYMDLYSAVGASATNGIAGYQGCYTDYATLKGYTYSSDFMSVDICNSACFARGYAFAGIRNGNNCQCGATAPSLVTTSASCNNPCTGNSTQNCGTASNIAVYSLADTGLTTGNFVITTNSSGYGGCFAEGSTRLLPTYSFTSNKMTNELCISNCKSLGYAYAGSEYASQCYCANNLDPLSGGYPVQSSRCTMACSGGGEICGGSSLVSVWSTASYTAAANSAVEGLKGCYATGTIMTNAPLTYSGNYMTTGLCRRSCHNKGHAYAGLSNGNVCYCADSATYGAAIAPASCGAPCAGNSSQTCGGASYTAVSVFDTTGAGAMPPSGYPANYIGCYTDSATRVLNKYSYTNQGMWSTMCKSVCSGQSYSVYGTESGDQCFCGSAIPNAGLAADSSCSASCPGASSEKCGGSYFLSMYSSSALGSTSINTTSSAVSGTVSSSKSSSATVSVSASKASISATAPVSATKPVVSSATKPVVSSATSVAKSTSTTPVASIAKSSAPAVSSTSKAPSLTTSTSTAAKTSSHTEVSSASSVSKPPAASSTGKVVTTMNTGGNLLASDTTAKSSTSVAASSAVTTHAASSTTHASSASTAKPSTTVPASSAPATHAPAPSTSAVTSHSASTSTKASSTTAVRSSTTVTSSAAPTVSADPSYVGCYTGSSTVFSNANMSCDSLTPDMCRIWCNANSYTYSGTTKGNYCGCSNDISELASSFQCSAPCIGDSTKLCGSTSGAFSVYKAAAVQVKSQVKRWHAPSTKRSKSRQNIAW